MPKFYVHTDAATVADAITAVGDATVVAVRSNDAGIMLTVTIDEPVDAFGLVEQDGILSVEQQS